MQAILIIWCENAIFDRLNSRIRREICQNEMTFLTIPMIKSQIIKIAFYGTNQALLPNNIGARDHKFEVPTDGWDYRSLLLDRPEDSE